MTSILQNNLRANKKTMTPEQITYTITAARDSVSVVTETLEQLAEGKTANRERKGNIERNVGHLKLVVANQEIVESGESITDLQEAIVIGEAKLAENIWIEPVVVEE